MASPSLSSPAGRRRGPRAASVAAGMVLVALIAASCGSTGGAGDPFRATDITSVPDSAPDTSAPDGVEPEPGELIAAGDITTDPVGTVNGRPLPAQDVQLEIRALLANDVFFDQFAAASPQDFDRDTEAVSGAVLAQILTRHVVFGLIEDEVKARGITLTPEEEAAADQEAVTFVGSQELFEGFSTPYQDLLRRWNRAQMALAGDLSGVPVAVDDQAVAAYFESNREDFVQFCSRHILVETEEEANDVLERLDAGEAFGDLAQELSIDTGSGAQGGDVGCVGTGQFVPEFEEAALSQPLGEVGEPVQSQFGFHIIVVDDRPEPDLDELGEEVRMAMQTARDNAINTWLQDALFEADVQIEPSLGTWNDITAQVEPPTA